jgi:hypothetical protein
MSVGIRPEEPEQLECDVCLMQIPADGANNAENDDYVLHFFGTECYRRWRAQHAPAQQDD